MKMSTAFWKGVVGLLLGAAELIERELGTGPVEEEAPKEGDSKVDTNGYVWMIAKEIERGKTKKGGYATDLVQDPRSAGWQDQCNRGEAAQGDQGEAGGGDGNGQGRCGHRCGQGSGP